MYAYKTAQIADLLNISTSSIRKYCIAVEKNDSTFTRDDRGERLFTEQDLAALRRMRELITGGRTMDEAAVVAATLLKNERSVREEAGEILVQDDRALFREMAESIVTLTEQVETMRREQAIERAHMREVLARLETVADDGPAEDADSILMDELLKETQYMRKEIREMKEQQAAAIESEKAVESGRKWWRFGK